MTEDRPRPAYGEYATPEQQAAAMGIYRLEPATAGVVSEPLTPAPPYGRTVGPRPPAPSVGSPLAQKAGTAQPTSRRWDLFLTSLLLAYGLWSVVTGLVQYSNLTTVAQTFYTSQGMGTFTSSRPALAQQLGLTINISSLLIFVIVAYLAYRLLRRGRIAFWVPLTGGVLASIIAAACLVSFLFTDPSFSTYFSRLASGA